MKDFRYYHDCFTMLRTARYCGRPAPHKALLLLSVIDLIERGFIHDNRIELSDILIREFNVNAKRLYGSDPFFKPNIFKPFYHMQSEPFWQLVEMPVAISAAAEPTNEYGKQSTKISYTAKFLRQQYRYAVIDTELFELLRDETNRARLRVALINTYLDSRLDVFVPIATMPLYLSLLASLVV